MSRLIKFGIAILLFWVAIFLALYSCATTKVVEEGSSGEPTAVYEVDPPPPYYKCTKDSKWMEAGEHGECDDMCRLYRGQRWDREKRECVSPDDFIPPPSGVGPAPSLRSPLAAILGSCPTGQMKRRGKFCYSAEEAAEIDAFCTQHALLCGERYKETVRIAAEEEDENTRAAAEDEEEIARVAAEDEEEIARAAAEDEEEIARAAAEDEEEIARAAAGYGGISREKQEAAAQAAKAAALEKARAAGAATIERTRAAQVAAIEKARAAGEATIERTRAAQAAALEKDRAAGEATIERTRAAGEATLERTQAAQIAAIEKARAAQCAAHPTPAVRKFLCREWGNVWEDKNGGICTYPKK